MTTNNLSTKYTAPLKPPLLVHLTKYKQFWVYELKRNWKNRTILLVIFLTALFLLWWVYFVQQPYAEQQQAKYLTSASLQQDIADLELQLHTLKNEASDQKLELLQRHIFKDYASISALLEEASTLALQNKFRLTYVLSTPVSKQLKHLRNVASMGISLTLTPLPKTPSDQVWFNLMKQIHTMFEIDQRYQLLSIHTSSSNNHINKVTLDVSILTQLDNWKTEGGL